MRICVAVSATNPIFIEVDELGTIEDIKILVESQTSIPVDVQKLVLNGKTLLDSTGILDSGLLENDIIQLFTNTSPVHSEALSLIQQANNTPAFLNHLQNQNPELAALVKIGNIAQIEQFLMKFIMEREKAKLEKQKHQQVGPIRRRTRNPE